ncbi:MAG: hypothetical protein IPK10_04060 [Bacteroidetes bacterium]|nr:hypothetical protein [Bacteroidota bacterium]
MADQWTWRRIHFFFPSNGNNLFVATTLGGVGYYGAGIFLSTNNGATWTPKNSGLLCTSIYTLLTNGTSILQAPIMEFSPPITVVILGVNLVMNSLLPM